MPCLAILERSTHGLAPFPANLKNIHKEGYLKDRQERLPLLRFGNVSPVVSSLVSISRYYPGCGVLRTRSCFHHKISIDPAPRHYLLLEVLKFQPWNLISNLGWVSRSISPYTWPPPHWSLTWVLGRSRSHKLSRWSMYCFQGRDQWLIPKGPSNSYLTGLYCSRHFFHD